MVSAGPSSSTLHVQRAHHSGESTFLSKRFSEFHMAISEPVAVARVIGSAEWLKQMSCEADQLLLRDLKSPYDSLHFYHILSPRPRLAWLLEKFPAELRDAAPPFSLC